MFSPPLYFTITHSLLLCVDNTDKDSQAQYCCNQDQPRGHHVCCPASVDILMGSICNHKHRYQWFVNAYCADWLLGANTDRSGRIEYEPDKRYALNKKSIKHIYAIL